MTVTVAGASQGLAGAAALSKSSATGVAQTTGIYGGEGRDEIRNAGKIDVGAKADVDSANVAVGVTVAKEGLAGGAALSDASALATATAKGIDGAEGDDLIVNTGEIKARVRVPCRHRQRDGHHCRGKDGPCGGCGALPRLGPRNSRGPGD